MPPDVDDLRAKIESIGAGSTDQFLPLVYAELKQLAERQLRGEAAKQTLHATALVHEAYLRVLGPAGADAAAWAGRGHFFAAVAEAMRRILVDRARARGAAKRGGGWKRIDLDLSRMLLDEVPFELLDLDAALTRLAEESPEKAELVRLRYFAGLTLPQVAQVLGISLSTADRHWSYARAWLFAALGGEL
jgi:RNA polymerase sigma factor (TIGR02999 family)